MENRNFGEKEILTDLLCTQKHLTGSYNTSILESATPAVLACFDEISRDEHRIQRGVFDLMHTRGMYPTPSAEEKRISEAKETYGKALNV